MTLEASTESERRLPKGSNIFLPIALFLLLISFSGVLAQEVRSGWERVDGGPDANLNTAEAINSEIWAFGDEGVMLRSLDEGITWEVDSTGSHEWSHSDSGYDSILIATDGGVLIILENIGNGEDDSNQDIPIFPGQFLINDVALKGSQEFVTVGENGEIWEFDGDEWINRSIGFSNDLLSVSFLDEESGIISGENGTILATDDGGSSWDYRDAPGELSAVDIIGIEYYSSIRAYAISEDGHILKSSREGNLAVGFVWNIVEIEREYPAGGGNEFVAGGTELDNDASSLEVLSQSKIMLAGPNGYLSLSKDGGNIVSQQMIPVSNETGFNAFAMLDGFTGVVVGDGGAILRTENAGSEEFIGFEVADFGDFGQFVDYSKERLMDGLVATAKIVFFGIIMGFSLGIVLSMLKTSPTTLKNVAQTNRYQFLQLLVMATLGPLWVILKVPISVLNIIGHYGIGSKYRTIENPIKLEKILISIKGKSAEIAASEPLNIFAIRVVGMILFVFGVYRILSNLDEISALNLDGWEHIYSPIGAPASVFWIIVGLAIAILGGIFLSCNGNFSIRDLKMGKSEFSLNPWGIRPLNAIATAYTDIFRNTPLLVQFMFIHFGFELGRRMQDPGLMLLNFEYLQGNANFLTDIFVVYETNPESLAYGRPVGGILEDRAYISAIFALGLNSGAYQCETIRGAIAAIPSGQMEAGRSIGLNYMQSMRLVVMPQAVRICIPPLGNEMVNLVLNSSLAMIIGYAEITRQGKLIVATTFQVFWTWGMVLVSYFLITWTLALFLRYLEERTRIPGLGISGGA
ncbi:MAG: ABC transporter permease subunit [Candidatus Thalassarchaeaceae archaeon]|nr:ABC transporter permease subunit [Candidatus Thalassarchaeaceae archaeon]